MLYGWDHLPGTVRRKMATPAYTCKSALMEATEKWPNRSRASDGIMGDLRHKKTPSDHNEGNAFDLTHDPSSGCDAHALVERLKQRKDHRVKYIISNARIWAPGVSPAWRPYSGSNPHRQHAHVSIYSWKRDDRGLWWLPEPERIPVPARYIVDALNAPNGGLWLLGSDGGIFAEEGAPFYGSYPGLPAEARQGSRTFVSIQPFRQGYVIVADDGAMYRFEP